MGMRKWTLVGLAGTLVVLLLYLLALPGCWSSEMTIVNSSGKRAQEIVIRMGGQILWRGALDFGTGTRATFPMPDAGDLAVVVSFDTGPSLSHTALYTMNPSSQKWLMVIEDDMLDAVPYSPTYPFNAENGSILGTTFQILRLLALEASCPIRSLIPPVP